MVAVESPAVEPSTSPIEDDTTIPAWFMKECVIAAKDWSHLPESLIVREGQLGDKLADEEGTKNNTYEIDATFWDRIMKSAVDSTPPYQDQSLPRENLVVTFPVDALIIEFPNKAVRCKKLGCDHSSGICLSYSPPTLTDKYRGLGFLDSVVRHLARAVTADLITLHMDDIRDLAEHILPKTEKWRRYSTESVLRWYFSDENTESSKVLSPNSKC
jgi:hypothetical protein